MGSTEPDRSLSSGISIPQWMKTKIGDRYDIEETFSPPSHDDSFFYIRYPKSEKPPAQEPIFSPIQVLEQKDKVYKPQPQDFSQHTLPCQQFIPQTKMSADVKELPGASKHEPPRLKSQGTDDGFTGDGAACGKSVIQVAQQMIAGKMILRGFSLATGSDNLSGPPGGFDPSHRRGSRSLPASPLGTPSPSPESSPRLHRKTAQNRYFTGMFGVNDKGVGGMGQEAPTGNRYPGSWILSSFLGQRENISGSLTAISQTIHEEEHVEKIEEKNTLKVEQDVNSTEMRRNKSTPSFVTRNSLEGKKSGDQNSEVQSDLSQSELSDNQNKKAFRAKPSELREMNFWSPTSM